MALTKPQRVHPAENVPGTMSWYYNDYLIEVNMTIFRGHRITVREVGSYNYLCNWCAGQPLIHAFTLFGLAMAWIDQDFPKFPFQSNIKPYFNDMDFVEKMLQLNSSPYNFYKNEK